MKHWKRMMLAFALLIVFTAIYPAAAQSDITVKATAQPFEGGLMIWRSDTALIWVLGNNGRVLTYPSSSYGRLPDNPIFGNPPSRLRPIFGFGQVWGNFKRVRDLLGWPTATELGFDMRIQYSNRSYYLTQMDGSVITIAPNRTWSRNTPPPPTVPLPLEVGILSFTASPNPAAPGSTLTATWAMKGADEALLEMYSVHDNSRVIYVEKLPIAGSASLTVPNNASAGVRLVLTAAKRINTSAFVVEIVRLVSSELKIDTQQPLGIDINVYVAYQPYERGFMIWRSDTGNIYVFGQGQVLTFPQANYQSLPDNPFFDTPPDRVRPINGFGKVWGNTDFVKTTLGWATGNENGYQATLGVISVNDPLPRTLLLPDGRKVYLNGTSWGF
jgi:hypothetical protein